MFEGLASDKCHGRQRSRTPQPASTHPITIQLSRFILPPFWLPVPHGFLWHSKFSFPSPSSKATSSLLQPRHSLLHFLSVRWISSVPFLLSPANFPSSLGLLSNRRASQAGGRRGSWALLLTQSPVLVACSLAQLVRTQEGATTSSVYFFPSSPLFPTCLSAFPSCFSLFLLSPSLLSLPPQSLSFFLPLLDLIPMGFRSLIPILDTTKLRLGEFPSDPKSQG